METIIYILNISAILFAIFTLFYFIHLLLPDHRPRYLEIGEQNDLSRARQMLVEDSDFAWNGLEIVTNEACAPVYNDDAVKNAIGESISKHKIKPENARVIVGPIITTINNQNELLTLYLNKKITIRQLNESPKRHFRLFGPRLYIEEPHDTDPNVKRIFYRLHSISKYISPYSEYFDELWEKASPLPDDINAINRKPLKREDLPSGEERWVMEDNLSKSDSNSSESCLS